MAAFFHSPLLGLLPLPDLYMLLCLALILGHSYTHSSLALWLADLYAEKSLLWTEVCPPQKFSLYEKHYANKLDKFLKRWTLPKFVQEIDNLNSPTYIKNFEFMVENLLPKKISDLDGFTDEFYQTQKKLYQF